MSSRAPSANTSASAAVGRPRRHRSEQRERILDWLRHSDLHPTALQVHEALARELPQLSLGTVYRNLEVLVAQGEVEEVLVPGGPARYDARLSPHHHFVCTACGRILDLELPVPRGLARRLADAHGLRAERVRISFHGPCPDCAPDARRAGREAAGRGLRAAAGSRGREPGPPASCRRRATRPRAARPGTSQHVTPRRGEERNG